MRFLVVYAVVVTIAAAAVGSKALSEHQRAAALEQQLAAATHAPVATAPAAGGRTFKASNGVVLGAADVARLETQARDLAKWEAEMEWFKRRDDSRRAQSVTPYNR